MIINHKFGQQPGSNHLKNHSIKTSPLILPILKASSEAAAVDAMDGLPFPVTVPGEANES